VVCCGRDDAASNAAAAIGQDLAALREHGLAEPPPELVDKIGHSPHRRHADLPAVLDLDDLDTFS